jgi:3-oxoadipate enol-lactonase
MALHIPEDVMPTCLIRPWGHMHYADTGPVTAPVILWANSLGTDLRMWDGLCALLPGWRHLRIDKRGHGLSATPDNPWDIGDLAGDAVALMDHLGVSRAVFGGCSVGGMVAMSAAVRHPARVRGLILSNTAAKIGTSDAWQARIAAVDAGGLGAITDAVMERWFPAAFRATPAMMPWRTMLLRCDPAGYTGTCAAIARADLRADVAGIDTPTLMIAGTEDLATPPALVAETCAMIPNARLITTAGAGHLPAIDATPATATAIATFLKDLPHD